jgi:hypothetical protein
VPSSGIDMFFACSLLVSVALIATAFVAGAMQTQITGVQDLNQESYLQGIADHLVSGYGSPVNWGSSDEVPSELGLAVYGSTRLFTLDADKVCRLNSQNQYGLSYAELCLAARLNNIAFGVSVSQMLTVQVESVGNQTVDTVTAYSFRVEVSNDAGSVEASLQGYLVTSGYVGSASNDTTSTGVGYVDIEVPNSEAGPALLVVFARAAFDSHVTAYGAYSFGHLSEAPSPNLTYLQLSPLDSTLNVQANSGEPTVDGAVALSYSYAANLTATSSSTFAMPGFLDSSPTVLVVKGMNGEVGFLEWTAYPMVPLDEGSSFANSETHVFVYTVTIKDTLYKLTLRFGEVIR